MENNNNGPENENNEKITLDALFENEEHGKEARKIKSLLLIVQTLNESGDSEKEKLISQLVAYLLTADVTGETDGHVHDLQQLVGAALKKDDELRVRFITDENFRKEIEADKFFMEALERFFTLHQEIAHGGGHKH